jgi:hypothetical protein
MESEFGPHSEDLYYTAKGRAHDDLLRCKDCQSLETFATISKLGMCSKCGNKRFSEISVLNDEEIAMIRDGRIAFPDSDLFLKEFAPVEV